MFKIILTSSLSAFVIAGLSTAQPAIAQTSSEQTALVCKHQSVNSNVYRYTEVIMVPKVTTGYDWQGRPEDNRALFVFTPEFKAHLETRGYFGFPTCGFWETASKAEEYKQADIRNQEKAGFIIVTVTDWRPSNVAIVAAPSNNPEPAVDTGKRDSLIVRQPDEAPKVPVAKPASKPAVKAKPAAKPVSKKPLTQCGGKGQRRCQVKPM